MKVSVDISMYPLKDEYRKTILDFINRISSNPDINVLRNSMSTQIFGEYDEIMNTLHDEMGRTFEKLPETIFVCKFLGKDLFESID